jgi:4-amino-4-deoxy-L-arabinose transferase-like glycosyltransferase
VQALFTGWQIMNWLQKHDTHIFVFFLLCILFSVTTLFLWNINDQGFWMDEMYHALGAKYILTEGKPVFPTGDIYTRAMEYTYMVALSYKIFGVSEFAGRFPSFFFLVLFLVTSGYFVRRLFGTFPALLFLLVMALSPISIELARFSRMYTTFAFLYFFAAWSFFFGFERNQQANNSGFWFKPLFDSEIKIGINLKLLLLSGILFFIALHMHRLTLTFSMALGSYVFIQFLDLVFGKGIQQAILSKYGIILFLGIACTLGIAILFPEDYTSILTQAFSKPLWAKHMELTSSYYRVFLSESYPFFFFSYPVAGIYLIQRHKNIGLFLATNFLVLLLIHSFAFEMKQERYLYYILPFFFMTGVLFAVDLVKFIWNHFEKMPRFHFVWVKGICLIAVLVFLNT